VDHLAAYIDYCRDLGVNPPRTVVGAMAKQIKKLTDEGQPDDQITLALRLVADKGSPPAELPFALVKAQRQIRRAPLADFVREYGWPTGCEFVRGTHGGTHVYNPLGTARPPQGWPHAKPSRDEVEPLVRTLAALDTILSPSG
jgi:hypothetical protein